MSPDEKQSEIINMFNHIAPTYDTTNRVMSMGIDVSWRKEACKQSFKILNQQNLKIADIACGTGDMILHWQHESKIANVQIDDIRCYLPLASCRNLYIRLLILPVLGIGA